MSIANTLKTQVAGLFTKLGNEGMLITCTYTRVSLGAYDPSADTRASTTTAYSNVKLLRAKMTEDDMEWMIPNVRTMKLVAAYNTLPFELSDDDYVTIDSVRWNVHKFRRLPGDSAHIIFVREP